MHGLAGEAAAGAGIQGTVFLQGISQLAQALQETIVVIVTTGQAKINQPGQATYRRATVQRPGKKVGSRRMPLFIVQQLGL